MPIWKRHSGATGEIVVNGSGAILDCAYCPCDACGPYYGTTRTMTYAGFSSSNPNYTETTSPNGSYNVFWNGTHWQGSAILLGTYDDGINPPFAVSLVPAARCNDLGAGAVWNIQGSDATLGYNYTSEPLGTTATTSGSDPIYDHPGTLTIS